VKFLTARLFRITERIFMPELAEVDYFRRRWDPGMGKVVEHLELHAGARVFRGCETAGWHPLLQGAAMEVSLAHGKQMLFGFSGGGWLGVHLGMTGELRVESAGYEPGRHDHLVLRQAGGVLVFADSRMFGCLRLDVAVGQPPEWWRQLPPAVTSGGFSIDWVDGHLRRRHRSPIKAVLLDQAVFPGVGNWMADEILWRMGLHPLTPAGNLAGAPSRALRHHVRWVARRAMTTIGTDWSEPPASWLYRYRWAAGHRCPRPQCATALVREEAAGRTSCWCPSCQPPPDGLTLTREARPVGTGHRRENPLATPSARPPLS
jgi:formamidopyrimidine-DNA glycosylase